ncbi:hypothetical protein PR048_032115 [Dryococelus australis]|uniref:Uncharacterized protein n=1 Tax=Dryococelus australis TaxID=614101 RepID=A0ABQ9G1A8_9NEOP|nr:hypothetical protein PR048_032115 [Dryococelus australis]
MSRAFLVSACLSKDMSWGYGFLSGNIKTIIQPIQFGLYYEREKKRKHCTRVQRLARRGDGTLVARVNVAFIAVPLGAAGIYNDPTCLVLVLLRCRLSDYLPPPPPGRTGFESRWGHPRIFPRENRARRCRWCAGFLWDLPLPPCLHSGLHSPYSGVLNVKSPLSECLDLAASISLANIRPGNRVGVAVPLLCVYPFSDWLRLALVADWSQHPALVSYWSGSRLARKLQRADWQTALRHASGYQPGPPPPPPIISSRRSHLLYFRCISLHGATANCHAPLINQRHHNTSIPAEMLRSLCHAVVTEYSRLQSWRTTPTAHATNMASMPSYMSGQQLVTGLPDWATCRRLSYFKAKFATKNSGNATISIWAIFVMNIHQEFIYWLHWCNRVKGKWVGGGKRGKSQLGSRPAPSSYPDPVVSEHTFPFYLLEGYGGNTARLARRSDEALGVLVTVAHIAPSLLDLGPCLRSLCTHIVYYSTIGIDQHNWYGCSVEYRQLTSTLSSVTVNLSRPQSVNALTLLSSGHAKYLQQGCTLKRDRKFWLWIYLTTMRRWIEAWLYMWSRPTCHDVGLPRALKPGDERSHLQAGATLLALSGAVKYYPHFRSSCLTWGVLAALPESGDSVHGAAPGNPREDPPTNDIVWHDSHMREFGVTRPGIEP